MPEYIISASTCHLFQTPALPPGTDLRFTPGVFEGQTLPPPCNLDITLVHNISPSQDIFILTFVFQHI